MELLARIPQGSPKSIIDLGCGTGSVTRVLAARWPGSTICGIDHSDEMLTKARDEDAGGGATRIEWIKGDIADWKPSGGADIIYSNAALHWLPDHEHLIPRLAACVNEGGVLAIQMPLSWPAPSHRIMRETLADSGPDGGTLGTEELRAKMARRWVESAEFYHGLLAGISQSIDIWETEYLQVLTGDDPVFEWVRGTGLRPVLDGLGADDLDLYLKNYKERLRKAYPMGSKGETLYPFRRIFMVARF